MFSFRHGINLGGWLSQCEQRMHHGHYSTFITRQDLLTIAQWGFDHVRLPVDHAVLLDGKVLPQEAVLAYIDRCLEWCGECGLGLQLDMHMLPGYNIATARENTLFENAGQRQHSAQIWQMLTSRYLHVGNQLRFELLNEPEWEHSYAVSGTFRQLHEAVRQLDPNRVLVVGGNHYNHVEYMEQIEVLPDEQMVYTFHYYEPNLFTNQLYARSRGTVPRYDEEPVYPGGFPYLKEYLDLCPWEAEVNGKYCWLANDRALMQKNLDKALAFRKFRQKPIYLGEFGVCYHASEDRRCAWMRDLLSIAKEHEIPWCYWTYKEMDYGLVDLNGQLISRSVLDVLTNSMW